MKLPNLKVLRVLLLLCCTVTSFRSVASHMTGGQMSYVLLDSTGGIYHYRVTLDIYADSTHGQREAISEDDPAFLCIYDGAGHNIQRDTMLTSSSNTFLSSTYSCFCGTGTSDIRLFRRRFIKDYYLHPNTTGYTVSYQRCCRSNAISNLASPGDVGTTYSCSIPPATMATFNNSSVFTYMPPQEVCINHRFYIDMRATDVDGDSLSYELCSSLEGAHESDIKPIPLPPPFTPANYLPPYSYGDPMHGSVAMQIDPLTGVMSGTPNATGVYVISVCCNEWRHGILVNTTRKEFEIAVTSTPYAPFSPFAGNDTALIMGESMLFAASGAVSYNWHPGTFLSDTTIATPLGTFPTPGVYPLTLHAISDSGCTGDDTIVVTVYPYSPMFVPSGFTPNGDGRNDRLQPISALNSVLKTFKVFDSKGALIYTGNTGWDGTRNGQPQEMGSYLWEAIYEDNNGTTRKVTGNSILIR